MDKEMVLITEFVQEQQLLLRTLNYKPPIEFIERSSNNDVTELDPGGVLFGYLSYVFNLCGIQGAIRHILKQHRDSLVRTIEGQYLVYRLTQLNAEAEHIINENEAVFMMACI